MCFKVNNLRECLICFIRLATEEIDVYTLYVPSGKRLNIERIISVSFDWKT